MKIKYEYISVSNLTDFDKVTLVLLVKKHCRLPIDKNFQIGVTLGTGRCFYLRSRMIENILQYGSFADGNANSCRKHKLSKNLYYDKRHDVYFSKFMKEGVLYQSPKYQTLLEADIWLRNTK